MGRARGAWNAVRKAGRARGAWSAVRARARQAAVSRLAFLLLSATLSLLPVRAVAAPEEARPWARGVSSDRQAGAFRLFEAGNHAFEQSKYGEALDQYRAALRFWDHPIIHFNMAVCFIHLDRPVEAYEHLAQAMVYGPAPLGEDLHSQGLTYEKLLIGRLARIQVSCRQPGVDVSLDGRRLLTCPGKAMRVVLPGTHQLVARKPGHLTDAHDVVLLPARLQVENIALSPVGVGSHLERRWSAWMPWIVVGSGAGIGLVGLGLRQAASSDFDEYDEAFAQACPDGCGPGEVPAEVLDIRTRARRENAAAIATLAVGAATVAIGGVLVFLNQPRPVSPDERARAARAPTFAPILGRHAVGVSVELRF